VNLLEDASKEELRVVTSSFKKDNNPGPDGWTIEFFLGFYELVEEC